MRTYHATATVRNGQLVLAEPLPQELEGHQLDLNLTDQGLKWSPPTEDEFLAITKRIHAITANSPVIPDEALRRENLYDDSGRC